MGFWIRLVSRWVAGETREEVLRRAKDENERGLSVMINFLGEELTDEEKASEAVEEYLGLLDEIKKRGLDACITVKPTQLHLLKGRKHALRHFDRIVTRAKRHGIFVWMDMEGEKYTDDTMKLYLVLHRKHRNMGMSMQANLRRSERDLVRMLGKGAVIRLVKGAYRGTPETAFKRGRELDGNYARLMKMLFECGNRFAIGTHDQSLIKMALEMCGTYKKEPEFQFLIGIQQDLKLELVGEGRKVASYMPFGREWRDYIWRRLKERPYDLVLILRSLVSG